MIVLASGSPRRAQILRDHGVSFQVVKTDAPEVLYPVDPVRTVRENSLLKGRAAEKAGFSTVLSADTVVAYNGTIYGKPATEAEAFRYLMALSGQTHQVWSGVAFQGDVVVVRADVTFKTLTRDLIERYIKAVHPLDRAGAYDIDEKGDWLIAGYTGSYENIMGLPLEPLVNWGIISLGTQGAHA